MAAAKPQPPDFTMEDIATFQRCRKESFWRGSVPMVIGANLMVGIAQARGYFNNRPRLLFPSYFLASVVGYVAGKISYMGTCKDMFLQLHDSRVKDYLLGRTDRLPMPRAPDFVEGYTQIPAETNPPEGPLTYAQRREYYRQQQMAGHYGVPQQSFPLPNQGTVPIPQPIQDSSQSSEPQQMQPESSKQSQQKSEYFDSQRPLSSFFQDDDYKPRD